MNTLLTVALLAQGATAFAPAKQPLTLATTVQRDVKLFNAPFFASEESKEESAAPLVEPTDEEADQLTLEEEVEQLTAVEVRKMKRASNLRNANGVEYAPWMNITPEAEDEIKTVMKQKAEARRKRKDQEAGVSGALLMDSQAQELSGGGLNCKVMSDNEVELTWATSSETATKGFAIKRRAARTEDFTTIVSYETWGPLASKGVDGGQYSFIDDQVYPGGWVYRITECENNGSENDICQALVDVQTADEQRGAVIAAVAISVLGVAAFVAGLLLDPNGGY